MTEKKWEYAILSTAHRKGSIKEFDGMGWAGWELVLKLTEDRIVFKRPLKVPGGRLQFVCAHCGSIESDSLISVEILDCGTTLRCGTCGEDTVIMLVKPVEYRK